MVMMPAQNVAPVALSTDFSWTGSWLQEREQARVGLTTPWAKYKPLPATVNQRLRFQEKYRRQS
jgi:hypothetical protein